jgi:hypothetical protein
MPETCTAEQADFRNAWQQNGTAKVAAFLSPHELGELRTAVDAAMSCCGSTPTTIRRH